MIPKTAVAWINNPELFRRRVSDSVGASCARFGKRAGH
jgi:hypothetical protein